MARKTKQLELSEYLRTRYCYTFLITSPHAVPVNVAVLADDDSVAWARIKKLYNTAGTKHELITRAAAIIAL